MLFSGRSMTFVADSNSSTLAFESLDLTGTAGAVIADVQVIEIPQAVTTILNNDPTLQYDAATGKFYRFVSTITQPLDAINAATSATLNGVNGQLATIRSAYENELIRSFAQQVGGDVLLGGRDATTEGNWYFLDGSTESEKFSTGSTAEAGYYTNWRAAEPNGSTGENNLAIRPDGEWQDVPDNQSRSYVIEWDASVVLSNFTFSITDQDPSGPLFVVDSSTGEIRLADPQTPDAYTDHILWLDVSDSGTVTTSGSNVTAITDKTGTGNNASQGSFSPTLVAGALNGLDAIQFDGVDDRLFLNNSATLSAVNRPERSTTIVFQTGSDTNTRQVIYEQGAQFNGLNLYVDGDQLYAGFYSENLGWNGDWLSTSISQSTTYVVTSTIDSHTGELRLFLNGALVDTGETPVDLGLSTGLIGIGAQLNNSKFHDGDDESGNAHFFTGLVGELTFNNASLAGDEVVDLHAHLMHKWIGTPTTPDYETATSHSVEVQVTDAAGNSYAETMTIAVDNGLDANQTVPGSQSVNEDSVLTFSTAGGNAVSVSDSLAGTNTPMQVTLSVNDGVLNLSGLTGITIVAGANGSGSITFNGTESDINAALEGMTFTPAANFNGSVTLNMTTSLAADLQAHYTFESDASDQSVGVANDGTLLNGASIVHDPERGNVLSLNGIDQAVDLLPQIDFTDTVTLSAWVNVPSVTAGMQNVITLGNDVILGITATGTVQGAYRNAPGSSTWNITNTTESVVGTGWHHITYTMDTQANVQRLYIDGQLAGETTHTEANFQTANNHVIGSINNFTDRFLGGLIDDARVYARSLSADEVAALAGDQTEVSASVAITVDPANDAPSFGGPAPYGFTQQTVYSSLGMGGSHVEAADVDGDGDMDIALASAHNDTIGWLENDGFGNFAFQAVTTTADGATYVTVADIDGDGDMDLIAASSLDNTIAWYENDGNENFTQNLVTNSVLDPTGVTVADIDEDGDLDLLVTSKGDSTVAWYENNGNQSFVRHVISTTVTKPTEAIIVDLDQDNDLDFLWVGNSTVRGYYWARNDGNENFTQQFVGTHGGQPLAVGYGDLDGDGDFDVIAGGGMWFENDGAENFTTQTTFSSTLGWGTTVLAVDIDNDGDLDIATTATGWNYVRWFENDGTGNYSESSVVSSLMNTPRSVAAADFNGDGQIDLVSTANDTVDVYRNNGGMAGGLNANPTFVEDGASVVLDANVSIFDENLNALNGGNGDYSGASLTIARNISANGDDVLSFADGNGITLVAGNLLKNGQAIASFDTTSTAGQLVITFTNANSEIPTSIDVDNILRQITYANSNDTPPASVQLDWTFNDGNTGFQGTGGALTATGSTTVNITATNDAPSDLTGGPF